LSLLKTDEVAYANTIVKQGEMLAIVINTGEHTNFHSVVSIVAKAQMEERSHFQKNGTSNWQIFDTHHRSTRLAYYNGVPVPA
jgi:magnesium-transporting ATPase (P-type)